MAVRPFWRRPAVRIGLAVLTALVALLLFARSPDEVATPVAADGEDMRAVVYREYGTAEVLEVDRVPRPVPGAGQVLIAVVAAAANPLDWHYMRGTPYVMRLDTGLLTPDAPRLGADVAGRVTAVGPGTRFRPGDEVFGVADGAFAEYALAADDNLWRKPANVTFRQAAGVGVAAVTALQGLRDKGRVRPGDRVLIVGASGGVGTFAVQIAKAMGADVTGVCSGRNVALVKSLGADRVIDYTKVDYTDAPARFDVVLDLVGERPLLQLRGVLKPDGRLVMIGGGGPDNGKWLGPVARMVAGGVLSVFVSQDIQPFMATIEQADLEQLAGLMAAGKLVPVVDRIYPSLSHVREAIEYLEQGRSRGKVIVEVAAGEGA